MPKICVPVIEADENGETCYKHPSYGIVGFSRVQCTPIKLFGSDIKHSSFIKLRIGSAVSRKDNHLHQDSIGSSYKTFIEVNLTNSQFAELLTTMNIGDGVPCTIAYDPNVGMIEYAEPYIENVKERSERMLEVERVSVAKSMKKLKNQIDEILEKKTPTKEQKQNLNNLMDNFISLAHRGMDFAETCFKEECEKNTLKMKTEIDATLVLMRTKLGLPAIEYEDYIDSIE